MTDIILCDKCGCSLPKQRKREYKLLWFNFVSTKDESWAVFDNYGRHLCRSCLYKFERWINER